MLCLFHYISRIVKKWKYNRKRIWTNKILPWAPSQYKSNIRFIHQREKGISVLLKEHYWSGLSWFPDVHYKPCKQMKKNIEKWQMRYIARFCCKIISLTKFILLLLNWLQLIRMPEYQLDWIEIKYLFFTKCLICWQSHFLCSSI